MKEEILAILHNSLFKNSVFPILATGATAFLGFLFWLLVARVYPTDDVGIAGTLISIMNTLAVFSLFGLDSSAVRYLSNSERKNEDVTLGLIVISFVSLMLTGLFLYFVPFLSPALTFITESKVTIVAFLFFTITSALNIYTDALFLAYRSTKYTFTINTIFSTIKVFLPFFFVGFGAFGILLSAAVAQAFGFILSMRVLVRTFTYRPTLSFGGTSTSRTWKFGMGNYLGDVLLFLPTAVIPILVTNTLGAEQAAYYYVTFMLAGFLYVIPASTMRSLFAEGSSDILSVQDNVLKSLLITFAFLTPSILFFFLFGRTLLLLFGVKYATIGLSFLNIMVLTSIMVTFFTLFGSLFKIREDVRTLLLRNTTFAVSTILLVYFLLPRGLMGVGIAFLGGYSLAVIVSFIFFSRKRTPVTS